MIFDKGAEPFNKGERIAFLANSGRTRYPCANKSNIIYIIFSPYIKIQIDHRSKCKTWNYKTSRRKKKGEKFCNPGLAKEVLAMTLKAQSP